MNWRITVWDLPRRRYGLQRNPMYFHIHPEHYNRTAGRTTLKISDIDRNSLHFINFDEVAGI
jgi:hypothetical protein